MRKQEVGEASLAGSRPGLRKELPLALHVKILRARANSLNLGNAKAVVRPICPCRFKGNKITKLTPRPSASIKWHYYNFTLPTHLRLAQVGFSSTLVFFRIPKILNDAGLGTRALITVSTRGLCKVPLTLKCVTWKAGCLTKQKNGTFLIPEVPDQGDYYFTRFLKRGGSWGKDAAWSFFFFFLQTSS